MAVRINFIDLYTFYNEIDASVVEALLEDYSISCSVRTLNMMRVPAQKDFPEKRIAVEMGKIADAKKIINDAIKKGVISSDGRFIA